MTSETTTNTADELLEELALERQKTNELSMKLATTENALREQTIVLHKIAEELAVERRTDRGINNDNEEPIATTCIGMDVSEDIKRIKMDTTVGLYLSDMWEAIAGLLDDAGEEYVTVGELVYTEQECYINALKLDPCGKPQLWYCVGEGMQHPPPPGEVPLTIEGEHYTTALQCYLKALEINSNDFTCAWNGVASELRSNSSSSSSPTSTPSSSSSPPTVTIAGKEYTAQECNIKALEIDPDLRSIWFLLAISITNHSKTVLVGGVEYTRQKCLLRQLEVDPEDACTWNCIASDLTPGTTAAINGRSYTKKECLEKSVEIHPSRSSAWTRLAQCLSTGEFASVEGVKYDRKQCYTMALEVDSATMSDVWCLAATPGGLITVDGKEYTEQQCYIKALEINPSDAIAWYTLGEYLQDGSSAWLRGNEFTKQQCYLKALEYDPKDKHAWFALGANLSHNDGDSVSVGGVRYNKQQCFIKSLEIDGSNRPSVWYMLGSTSFDGEGTTVTVSGRDFTKQQCLDKST